MRLDGELSMAISLEHMQQDHLAMSVARAIAAANEAALAEGIEPGSSLVTITEEPSPASRVWRIHYGPRDYVGQRGGDFIVLVDDCSGNIQRILHGQ